MKRLNIARVAHEVNRAYCQALGDNSQVAWVDAPQWQKDSAYMGVALHLNEPNAGPEASHESWSRQKVAEGWVYGPSKDPENKRHPCLVPFADLPVAQQAKDYLFKAVVNALAPEPLPDSVTMEAIHARIAGCEFVRMPDGRTTICQLTLDNGFTVLGESSCVDPANYKQHLGEKYSREQAIDKLWPLLGFLLTEDRYRATQSAE